MIRVWGLAWGRRTTKEATLGAFTFREYEDDKDHREDWQIIIKIEKEEK